VLNLAPAPREAADIVAAGVDWLVVNESEAAAVLGRPVTGLTGEGGAVTAAAGLARAGARNAVVTAGAAGAAYSGPAGDLGVPGFTVRPVDSVGAGDTFVAALAVALAAGVPPHGALVAAAAAGAAAVTRPGTQAGMPRPADVLAATGHPWPVPAAGPACQ
jgi:ribokinase